MCGIFGFVSWDRELPPVDQLARATNLLTHRGPDGGAYWQEPGVFLGHRRLAIIDLATGDQPMASIDGRYVITFNGEIYNYPELREQLRAAGAGFATASDTEVILAGYAIWGRDVVARLEGMFAFALYDRRERTLLLARDRFGEKPLLYAAHDGRVVFASELSPIVANPSIPRDIDGEALGGYLSLNYVPGARTMLRSVQRVLPGEWRLFDARGEREVRRYWRPSSAAVSSPTVARGDALLDELQARLDHAVRLTLRSDVPVGLFLSGGIDSSIVAESAARLGKLEAAYCVDFADTGFSELPLATRVAKQLDIELVRVGIDSSVLNEFIDVAGHLDDPLADSSAMAVWTVAQAASQRMKVVLSGDGGDELFGGYLTYPASRWHARLSPLLPRAFWAAAAGAASLLPVNERVKVSASYKLQRFLRAMPLDTGEAHFTWNGTWMPAEAARLTTPAFAGHASSALARLAHAHGLGRNPSAHDLQLADLEEYLPHDILSKVDRATMAHGLESRAPLLNRGVAELALAMPEELRIGSGGETKVLLRRLCARHFGEAHAHAPKQGFSLPIHQWLRGPGRGLMTGLLARERVSATGLLDATVVEQAVASHLSARRSLGWELWGLMVLVTWHERRVAAPPDLTRLPEARDLRPFDATSDRRPAPASPTTAS